MRVRVYFLVLMLAVSTLIVGLLSTQIMQHEKFRIMSEDNRLKIIPLMAPRGTIFDSRNNVVVKDVLSFNASVIYRHIKDMDSLTSFLSGSLALPKEEISKGLRKARQLPHSSVSIAPDIGIEKAVQLEEAREDYPGLLLEVSTQRKYEQGKTASALLGYLGFINRSEFDKLKHYGYRVNDLKGKDGVEKYYDDYLRGKHGGKQIEVDHMGREATILGFKEPTPGLDINLTIDIQLQKFCDELLEGKRGAIIVMDPNTGAVLALSSAPAYDPNIFIDPSRLDEVRGVLSDVEYPLINRAISGRYPPGSVFKTVTATAALEEKSISEWTQFTCPGHFNLGKAVFRCWRKSGHGKIDLREAIKGSCNVYFFRTGILTGVEKISKFASKFGFGKRSGIDLPGEIEGIVPSTSWKRKRFNEKWYKGDTVNFSIGQGYLLCSPVQLLRMMSVFANNGYLVQPYVVDKVGGVSVAIERKIDTGISQNTIKVIREGLKKVVNDPRGTGMKAKVEGLEVAGKTGTAQASGGKSHGWFSGFAPFEESKLALVVFDEFGGKGGYYAAETASKVFKEAKYLGLL